MMARRMSNTRARARARVELGPKAWVERCALIGPLPYPLARCRILLRRGFCSEVMASGHTWEDAFTDLEQRRADTAERWATIEREKRGGGR